MKKEIKSELTKEKILIAAMDEFGTKGYDGSSLNNICGNSGISKGLLYHNFKSKDELYLTCVSLCFKQLTEYLSAENIGADIHRYTDARLRFFEQNELVARLFFEVILQPPVQLKSQIEEIRKDFDNLNQALYRKMLASVSLRSKVSDEDAMWYFTLMQNMFNGYFSSPALCGLSFTEVMNAHEANLSKFLDYMLYGIAERGSVE